MTKNPKLKKAIKYYTVHLKRTHLDKLKQVEKCRFLRAEIDSLEIPNLEELARASNKTGIAVHRMMDSVHCKDILCLSHPDEMVKAKGLEEL